MILNDESLYFWLSMCPFPALKKFNLTQQYPIGEIFERVGKSNEWDDFLGAANSAKAAAMKSDDFLQRAHERLYEKGVSFISINHEDYPELLRQSEVVPPIGLYCKGDRTLMKTMCVSIVGTRSNSDYGAQVTTAICEGLKGYNVTVVSGMAFGIDACAHRAALDNGVKTIAVLASGVNLPTPMTNSHIYKRICENGLVISEYPIDTPAAKHTFPERNRLVAGLSSACIVVEAAFKSGALITADRAAEQSREVFAVPGSIFSKRSEGTNTLIKDGCQVFTGVKDILSFFNLQNTKSSKNSTVPTLDFFEQTIYNLLNNGELSVNELCDLSGFTIVEVLNIVISLEFKDLIIAKANNIYKQRGQSI